MRSSALLLVAACSSSSPAPHADAFPTADHTPYPQLPDLGGPRLASPQLVTVTFANDSRAATLEGFAEFIVGSSWIQTVGADYGVGTGGVAGVAHRPETPPAQITSQEVEAYLAAGIADGSIPHPANLADGLFIAYYPATTTITTTFVDGIVKVSCTDYGGYHSEAHAMGLDFAYAVIPSCGYPMPTLESVISHEVIEAASDAWPITTPAFQLRKDPTDVWYTNFGFEVENGDMCEAPDRATTEAGHTLQRIWSNTAAAAGQDPCIPGGASPAFGASGPATVQMVAHGGSADIPFTAWTDGTIGDFTLTIQPWISDGADLTHARAALSAPTANNGAAPSVHVTVPTSSAVGNHTALLVVASHGPTDQQMWPLVIVTQ